MRKQEPCRRGGQGEGMEGGARDCCVYILKRLTSMGEGAPNDTPQLTLLIFFSTYVGLCCILLRSVFL